MAANPLLQTRLDQDTYDAVQARGGPDYIRDLVEQRLAEVDGAIQILLRAGWDRHHIRQACGALDGAQHSHPVFGGGLWAALGLAVEDASIASDGTISGRRSIRVAHELHDAARLGTIDIDADRWPSMLATLRDRPDCAMAIQALARDYWSVQGPHPVIDDGPIAIDPDPG